MSMSSLDADGGVFGDINITPLTDIFLVLLIIFMVTTAVTIESAAHVDLPKAEQQADPNQKPKGIIVTYASDTHQVFVGDKAVAEKDLESEIRDALNKSSDKIVVFQGDPKVILGDMVRILDTAKRAGAEAIAIAASKAPAGGGPGGPTGAN